MINFYSLSYKNFLSTGNAGTKIQLNRSPTTLVQGPSGAGKSTMIDALSFALYGKPFRNINKQGLVNSVNGKNCEVEVVFNTNGKTYRVIRTIKPNKFDIYCDDNLVTQDAAVKDYQKVLESQILMMTFKTFTQIVILGSTAFTPFMQLNAAARREVIEDILDIGIFSTMNTLLKQHIQETKDQALFVDSEIKAKKEKADGLKRLIDALSSKKEERVQELNQDLYRVNEEILALEKSIEEKTAQGNSLKEKVLNLKQIVDANNSLSEKIALSNHDYNTLTTKHNFFSENDNCPTCSQVITKDHKLNMIQEILISIEKNEESLTNYKEIQKRAKAKIESLNLIVEEIYENNRSVTSLIATTALTRNRYTDLLLEIEKQSSKGDIDTPSEELKAVARDIIEFINRKKELTQQRQLQESASILLKDTGIKTAIIKEYLPLINKYLNKYLLDLQMDVAFGLDEHFNEVIKSRYRDEFVYGNFSEGEKLRVDIALLLCWRHIAKLKNSASTNLLIIDEVLSGRLDQTNQDIVIDMVNTLAHEGSNIFVIAHQDSLVDKFRSGVRFEKQGNFSVMI